ncbi:unnamed protein product [Phaedon cochleariae]|uniref:Reelin domain-containing protein n=1 Tax=Phaedon cochleariae TaxID=80249 RepID=A0A9N9X4W2_PHACE|nr:unnamed protein product [Phaedon cochleariae]
MFQSSQRSTRSQSRSQIDIRSSSGSLNIKKPNPGSSSSKNDNDEIYQKLQKEVDRLKMTLDNKEREQEDMMNQFLSEIECLKKGNEEKEKYILQLQKRSKDFEDEVYHAEESLLNESHMHKKTIAELNEEIKNLSEMNDLLQEENSAYQDNITKLENEMKEFRSIRENMLTSIEVLTTDNDQYSRELMKLRSEVNIFKRQKLEGKKGVENMVDRIATISQDIVKTRVLNNALPDPNTLKESVSVKNILIVAGYQGKLLGNFMRNQINNDFLVQSVIKPNCSVEELISTALNNSRSFTKHDSGMQERAQRISRSRSAPRRGSPRRPCIIVTRRTHMILRPPLDSPCCEALTRRKRRLTTPGDIAALPLPPQDSRRSGYAVERLRTGLTIQGQDAFKGFLIQGRDVATNEWIGNWIEAPNTKVHPECSAITHADPRPKQSATLIWQAPANSRPGQVYFTGTVLKEYSQFWSDMVSQVGV